MKDWLIQSLLRIFKIRRGEVEKTLLMSFYAFNAVAAFIVGRNMKNALFMADPGLRDRLPYMYIIVAVVVTAISLFNARQLIRFGLKKVVNFTTAVVLVLLLVFRFLLPYSEWSYWVVPSLYVFIEATGILLVYQFWTFANELFNAREAKRLFGIIVGGQVLGNLYSFPIRSLINVIHIENLLFASAASVGVCLILFNYLSKRYRLTTLHRGRVIRMEDKEQTTPAMAEKERQSVFISLQRHIYLIIAVTMFVDVFVDYQYNQIVAQYFNHDKQKIADFFFALTAYGGLIACIIQFFLTSRLIEKFGIWALFVLPVLLFGGGGVALGWLAFWIVPTLGMGGTGAGVSAFWGASISKGSMLTTRYTITETTTQILYQPLLPPMRRRVKAFADGVTRPLSQAVAGLMIILLTTFVLDSASVHDLSWIVLALIVGWMALIISARRRYVEALLLASDRNAEKTGLEMEEDERVRAVSRNVIQRALNSGDETQILNAIEVIPLSKRWDWEDTLIGLLQSPFVRVRRAVIERLGQSGNRTYSRRVFELFQDGDDSVRAMAIKQYCLLERERAIPQISQFLNSESPPVKAAAIAGLIQYGGLDGIIASTMALKTMLDSSLPVNRESGARVLGFIQVRSFYQPLFKLISDSEFTVRKAAVEAAGQMRSFELVPALIFNLGKSEMRVAAVQALAHYGEEILPRLEEVLLLPSVTPHVRRSIPPILALNPSLKAYEVLEQLLETRDDKLRTAVTRSMQKLTGRLAGDISPDYSKIQRVLHTEFEVYYQHLIWADIVRQKMKEGALLESALLDRAEESLERVFCLLGMIYPKEQIDIVLYNLKAENAAMRANAVEIIDNICEPETKRCILPIIDSPERREIVESGLRIFRLDRPDPVTLLRSLMKIGDDWLIACTIHAAGEEACLELRGEILCLSDHEDPVVREAVVFALKRILNAEDFDRTAASMFVKETDDSVRKYLESAIPA